MSQRSLATRLGIALGLTNLLVRRLVKKGLVRVLHVKPHRVRYLLTPTGIAEKARMSRAYFNYSVQFYAEARERIGASFKILSREWPHQPDGGSVRKRIMFFGTGEVAEIGYICLQETDLQLVGVIDVQGRRRFFDVPVHPFETLDRNGFSGGEFDHVVVMSFTDVETIKARLIDRGLSADRVFVI